MCVFIYTVYLTLVYMAVCIMILKFLWVLFSLQEIQKQLVFYYKVSCIYICF